MMLKSPTWIFPARSGSSLIAKMPRLARGSSPKCIVSSSDRRCPPRAALIGSTSPMISAIVTSGVASFSTNRTSRGSQAIGVPSPRSPISSRPYFEIGSKGSSLTSLPAMMGISSSSSVTSWQVAALRLAAEPEQNEVVARENRIDALRQDGLFVPHDARKHWRAVLEQADEVLAHFIFDGALAAGGTGPLRPLQLTECRRLSHGSTLNPSARALQPLRNAAHACQERPEHFVVRPPLGAPPLQQIDLQQAHRIYVRIAQENRPLQRRVGVEQRLLALQREHLGYGAIELLPNNGEEVCAEFPGEPRVARRDREIRRGEHHFHVVDQCPQKRQVAEHFAQRVRAIPLGRVFQRRPHAVPAGHEMAALRPREHPRNRAQLLDYTTWLTGAYGRTAANFHALDDVDRRRLPKVLHEPPVVIHERAVGVPALPGDVVHDGRPTGLSHIRLAG